jgi:uncharacterized membrane protein
MDVVSTMLALATLFVASHVGLALVPVRSRLTARLGEWGFVWVYFAVAAVTFSAATFYFAEHRFDGPPGPAFGRFALLRVPLIALIVSGIALMVAAFSSYGRSPYAVGGRQGAREPQGLERVTRHPFFAGMALYATAHALLATHLIASVLMLGLALLAVVGSMHQDRKLVRLHGERMAGYLAVTSALPFAAIASGRQRLVWHELPGTALVGGVALALVLSRVHDRIFADHGVWVILVVVGGALVTTLSVWIGARRTPRAPGGSREVGAARPA